MEKEKAVITHTTRTKLKTLKDRLKMVFGGTLVTISETYTDSDHVYVTRSKPIKTYVELKSSCLFRKKKQLELREETVE